MSGTQPPAGRATAYDAAELTRLPGVLLAAMGAVLDGLQRWFRAGREPVELAASEQGRGLCEAAGFRMPEWPQRWYSPRP